jgi:hypothetical protein
VSTDACASFPDVTFQSANTAHAVISPTQTVREKLPRRLDRRGERLARKVRMRSFAETVEALSDVTVGTVIVLVRVALAERQRARRDRRRRSTSSAIESHERAAE